MADNLSNNKRIAQNTIILYFRMIVVMLITLYTTRALLVALGVDGYGIYNVVCGFVSMFAFLNTSMANGVQRFYNYEIGKNGNTNISKIFSHSMCILLLLSFIIILIVESFGLWYLFNKMNIPEGKLTAAFWIFQFSMIQLVITMISVPYSALVMSYEKMNYYAYIGIVDAVLKLLFVLLLPFIDYNSLILYGFLMLVITVVDFLLYWMYCRNKFSFVKFSAKFDKTLFYSILSFSGWNIFGTVAGIANNQGLNLIYNYYWNTVVNAANGVAGQISAAVNSMMLSFVTAIRPQMIKSYALGDMEQLKRMYYSASKMTFFLISVFALPLFGEISTILDFWLGKGHYPTITGVFCQLTIILLLCTSFSVPSSIIVHATGNMKKFQIIVSLVSSSVLPFALIAASLNCEASFVIVISIVVAFLTQYTRVLLINRLIGFSIREYLFMVVVPSVLTALTIIAFLFLIKYIMPQNIIWSILKIFIGLIISCFFIYKMGLNESEKNLLKCFCGRIKQRFNKY